MNILSIGGSDPSSGAGIQADIKVVSALSGYCLTVITAITSQNTSKFLGVEPVSTDIIKDQLDGIISDFKIDAIKIGMVYNSKIIKAVSSKIKKLDVPIVIDPVIKSTTGGILLQKEAFKDFKKFLIPLADVLTPNVFEAEKLSGIRIKNKNQLVLFATQIRKIGAKNIVITGYLEKNKIIDFISEKSKNYSITGRKLEKINHGSGCNYSTALVCYLARGKSFEQSVRLAKSFVFDTIKNSLNIGKGVSITQVIKKHDIENQLYENITKFINLKNIYHQIPECQTNFVFSKNKPVSIKSVLGVKGRIVKSGIDVIVAGNLEFGGSHHVASAIIEISKKFPKIKSAINIKYNEKTIKKFKKLNYKTAYYNRKKEPSMTKRKENSSIAWGIRTAIKGLKTSPDIVYHKGDFGKEPMILVFGKNPNDVMKKISSVF